MQGLLLQQQPLHVFCRRGTTARAVRLPTCTSPCRRATTLRSPHGRAAGIRPIFIRTSATYCGGFPRGLKYVRGILKQVGHISNYVRPVFSLLPCGRNAPETSFRFSPARYAVSRPLFPRRTCPPRAAAWKCAGHGHKARATAIQRIYCRHAETAKTLLFSKNRQIIFVFVGKTQRFFR